MADVDGDDDDDDGLDWSLLDIDTRASAPEGAALPPPGASQSVEASAATRRRPADGAVATRGPAKRRRKADEERAARRRSGVAFHLKARLTDGADSSTDPKCVNLDRAEGEEPVYLPVTLNPYLKAHQLEGIRFLWTHVVRQPDPRLRGCVLAHSMGLGKTMQTIMFIYLFLRHQIGSKVLVVCPKSTLWSWAEEAEEWCVRCQLGRIRVRTLDDNCKRPEERRQIIEEWCRCGGILIVGYEMFTLLSGVAKPKKKAKGFEQDLALFREGLQDPGPDLVICDEGHRLKNAKLLVMVALKRVATTRRVVLTGTPLQNHLMEYFCMVDFVREAYWTRREFRDLFDAPIKAGQHEDSTQEEVRVMKRRAFALCNELKTFIMRRDQSILMRELPPKHEFVLVVRLSPLQQHLCRSFVAAHSFQRTGDVLYFTSMVNKICAHPDILRGYVQRLQKNEPGQKTKLNGLLDDAGIDLNDWMPSDDEGAENSQPVKPSRRKDDGEDRDCAWAECLLASEYQEGVLHASAKMAVLHTIIQKCLGKGEKLLVFSMWTSVLDAMERFLKTTRHPLTRAQWLARCQKGPLVRESSNPTAAELNDVLMSLRWRRRDIDAVLQLWDDPRMTTLKECSGTEEVVVLDKLRADLEHQAKVVAEQIRQVQAKRDTLGGPGAGSDDEACEAQLRPFVGYCRIDGGTPAAERQARIQEFNDPTSDKHVFLISTKAGGVGINLTAASRVVVFDVSWNPTDESQAIFRTYRYGQTRPVVVYRLVAEGTPEEKIYDMKVGKEWLFKKIVDELAPSRAFVKHSKTLDHLFEYHEEEDFLHPQDAVSRMNCKVRCMNSDPLLAYIYANNLQTIRKIYTHESLLLDDFGEQIGGVEQAESLEEYRRLRLAHALEAAAPESPHAPLPLASPGAFPAPKVQQPDHPTAPTVLAPRGPLLPPPHQPPATRFSPPVGVTQPLLPTSSLPQPLPRLESLVFPGPSHLMAWQQQQQRYHQQQHFQQQLQSLQRLQLQFSMAESPGSFIPQVPFMNMLPPPGNHLFTPPSVTLPSGFPQLHQPGTVPGVQQLPPIETNSKPG